MKTNLNLLATVLLGISVAVETTARDWTPVVQTNLAAAIDAAPELKFEELTDGPDACWEGPLWWVPNPDGKTWDMVFFYSRTYPGPHQVFIYDTRAKELKQTSVAGDGNNFHIVPYFLINGKMYIKPGIGAPEIRIFTYDPASNELTSASIPLGKTGVRGDGQMVSNEDGTLFGGFGPLAGQRDKVGFYTVDPVTLKGDFLGEVGPANPHLAWEYGGVVMDGDWIYARYGQSPWRLYGMNVKTREGQVIAETEPIIGDRSTIRFVTNPDYPGIYVTITGLKGGPLDKTQAFWLRDGKLTPTPIVEKNTQPIPPWVADKRDKPRPDFSGRMEGAQNPPKGFEIYRGPVDTDGKAVVWYRYTDATQAEAANVKAGEWQKIELPQLQLYPYPIRRMATLPDGSLFALSEGYGRAVTFDPKTQQRKVLGQTMSVYSLCSFEEKLYLCGYPGSQVWIYDPAKPWTAGKTPDAPPEKQTDNLSLAAQPDTNPAHVTTLKEFMEVHMPFAAAAGGDGRVYFGGKVVRIGNGGGLGWWDIREKKAGGFHKPFENYTIFWMCSAAKGRYILCSTKPVPGRNNPDYTPPRGRLFVYDTTKHEIIHQVDDARLSQFPGYITEALPGLVMGYAPAKEGGLLYGFDPAAGKVLWTKPVPRTPSTGFSAIRRWNYFFAKGPDGFIWATMNGVLARIDPQTVEVVPVGKMADSQIAFLDGDIYVAGTNKFRKITGINKNK